MSNINSNCVFHPSRIAYELCENCHKPLCNECAYEYTERYYPGFRSRTYDLCHSCYSKKLNNGLYVSILWLIIVNLITILLASRSGILIVVLANIIFVPIAINSGIKVYNDRNDTNDPNNCQFCGATFNPDDRFCLKCGKEKENSSSNN